MSHAEKTKRAELKEACLLQAALFQFFQTNKKDMPWGELALIQGIIFVRMYAANVHSNEPRTDEQKDMPWGELALIQGIIFVRMYAANAAYEDIEGAAGPADVRVDAWPSFMHPLGGILHTFFKMKTLGW